MGLPFGRRLQWSSLWIGAHLAGQLMGRNDRYLFGGAAWFAWLYVEWRNNLWLPIGLHILMNLYWALFDIESNALGGVWANVFRGLTIALSIIYTLRKKQPRIIGNG